MTLTAIIRELTRQKIKLGVEGDQLRVQAPMGVLTPELRNLIAENKADLLAWLQSRMHDTAATLPAILPQPDERHLPFALTDVQHAYWIGRSGALALGNVSTHSYIELTYTDLDVERLAAALNRVIARHEMLRAIILPTGQQQILSDVKPYEIPILDLRGASPEEQARQLAAVRQELSHQVLPLEQCPMFDIRVTRLSDTCMILHESIDILMFDIGSFSIIFEEWRQFYAHPSAILPAVELSFRDYVLAAEQIKTTPLYTAAREYWLKRIDALPPAPELPLVQSGAIATDQTFHRRSYRLEAAQWQILKAKAQQSGVSPSVLLLTAFAATLKAWCKQPRFTLNLTLFNRLPLHPAVNQLVGDFTSLVLVDVDYTTPISLAEQSKRLQRQLWEALEQRYFSGIEVMRELGRRQSNPQAGGIPVVFTSAIGVGKDGGNPFFGFLGGELRYAITQTPQVWLDHQVWEYQGGLLFNWDTVDAIFPAGLLDDMFAVYCDLIESLAADETHWNDSHLALLPAVQRSQRTAVNATEAPLSTELLHTLFLKQVEPRAAEPAVITPTQTITYCELYAYANQIGHWLRGHGIGNTPGAQQLVAVVMEKGWEQVAAVVGIHLAGAAYLPIDPGLPTERQHYLLQQGDVVLALTQSALDTNLTWPSSVQRLCVDQLAGDVTLPTLDIVQQPTDIAYVIYTSGSTGLPKGVVIDHRGAVNTILDINQRFGVTEQDRVLALSALNFDLSVYDMFGLLAVGGAIVIPAPEQRTDPAHWLELMNSHRVTLWDTVPALMQMLVEYAEPIASLPIAPSLRLVMMSGDWIPVTLPDRIKAIWDGIRVYSLGGATEASIWSIYYPIENVDPAWPSIPYGRPLSNQTFHVLDANLNPRPCWVPGDLYIGGIGLALGYWKDQQKTNERFITHPRLTGAHGARLYKTGDLGRYLPDGNIEFLGREDFQVKIRGHRIELGEIESTLLQHPEVKDAVVNAVGDPKGNRQLVAYVVRRGEAHHRVVQIPDRYALDEVQAGQTRLITDAVERIEFKLRQPGVRHFHDDATSNSRFARSTGIELTPLEFDEARRSLWLTRQSYRTFVDEPLSLAAFSDFLSCLAQMPVPDAPFPKYRYPSAGNLYAIQSYLFVKPGRIAGVSSGFYYYHPQLHRLIPLSDEQTGSLYAGINRPIFEQAAFALFLVANLEAIGLMYGEAARDFALLEAGYMSQLLMCEAPLQQIGLCPIGGGLDTASVQQALALGKHHEILPNSLLGGRLDPVQHTYWAQGEPAAGAAEDALSWQAQLQRYLQSKLPAYMVPSAYVALDALPLSANGKVDRKALPSMDVITPADNMVAPSSHFEKVISSILQEMLGFEAVGIDHEFAELGLNSVHIVRFNNHLKASLDRQIPLAALFQYATVRTLAQYLEQTGGEMSAKEEEEKTAAQTRREQRGQVRAVGRQRPRR